MPTNVLLFFCLIFAFPLIAGGAMLFGKWMQHKEKMAEALNAQTAEKAAQYAAHVERLEQRVRVLERIATDKGIELAGEIEQLRDDRHMN